MKFPLPDIRDRLSWTWIPREVNKINATYLVDHNCIKVPLDVFWQYMDKIPAHYLGYYDFSKTEMEVGHLVFVGTDQLQNQMDVYDYDDPES